MLLMFLHKHICMQYIFIEDTEYGAPPLQISIMNKMHVFYNFQYTAHINPFWLQDHESYHRTAKDK